MPFICLTRNDIPDGVAQILDLSPNESQKNNALDGPGQTRYVNRVQNDALVLTPTGVGAYPVALYHQGDSDPSNLRGLAAYLADAVDPGGSEAAVGTVQCQTVLVGDIFTLGGVPFTAVEHPCYAEITAATAVAGIGALTLGGVAFDCVEDYATGTIQVLGGATAGDTVTIAGVVFTAVNGAPVLANQEFQDVAGSGSAINTAASLVASINDPASQALLTAALDALVAAPTAGTLTGANGGTDTVTLTPSVAGVWGDATLAESTGGVNFTLSGAAMTHVDPVAANQEFGSWDHYEGMLDPNEGTVASLEAAVNDAASIALLDAANPGPAPGALAGHMIAAALVGTPNILGLTSSQVGVGGELTLVSAQPAALVLSDPTLIHEQPAAASQEFSSFLDAGTDILTAGTLVTTLNNAATDALLIAGGGSSVTAVNGGTDTITMTADTVGTVGAMAMLSSDPLTLVLGDDHLAKTMETWTAALLNASAAALIARMDAGTADMNAAGMNAAMNAVVGVSGISVAGASGSSSVAEILSILAGRGYEVPVGTVKDTTGYSWSTTKAGGFTRNLQTFGAVMSDGEWNPATPYIKHATAGRPSAQPVVGGDTETREHKPIRYTVHGTDFAISLGEGQIAGFANGVTLFPDSNLAAFVPTFYQPGPKTAEVNNARVVVAYDDDGTLLA